MIKPEDYVSRRVPRLVAPIAIAGCVAALATVLYVRTPFATKQSDAACKRSASIAEKIAPLEIGDVAPFTSPDVTRPMPALAFSGPDGKRRSLSDFKGKTVLVNLWATWCVPCRQEMPALDKLQAETGGKDFEIVAVNIDTTRLDKPKAFLSEAGVTHLPYYSDEKADIFYNLKQAGKITGLPTSYLVGPDGCEIATLAGPANWGSGDALALIKAAAGV